MRQLDDFCKKVGMTSYLWHSDEFQIFVRSTTADIEKALSQVPRISNEEIIEKYQSTFQELSGVRAWAIMA